MKNSVKDFFKDYIYLLKTENDIRILTIGALFSIAGVALSLYQVIVQ